MYQVSRRILSINIPAAREWRRNSAFKLLIWILDQVPNDPILCQLIESIREILPHQILGKRERRERCFVNDFETRNLSDGSPHQLKHLIDIDSVLIRRKICFQGSQIKAKILV